MRTFWGIGSLVIALLLLPAQTLTAQEPVDVGDTISTRSTELTEYALELEAQQAVEITLESDDFDTYLEVLDATGAVVADNDDIDFPSNTNSRLVFNPREAGTYIVRVRSFTSDTPNGTFTLTITGQTAAPLNDLGELGFDEVLEFETSGAVVTRLNVEAAAGDVVSALLRGETNAFVIMEFVTPDGELLAQSRAGDDANLLRVELPQDGTYRLNIRNEAEDEPLFGTFNLTLLREPLLLLNDAPHMVTLNAQRATDVLDLDVEAEESWIITVTADSPLEMSTRIELRQSDALFAIPRMNYNNLEIVSFLYTAETAGRTRIVVEMVGFEDDEATYTFEAEPLDG